MKTISSPSTSPDYNLYFLHRTYHSVYMYDLGLDLSNWIESQGNHLAVPIPSYAPMVFHGREPWGILSLKHAAVCAGLGAFGQNACPSGAFDEKGRFNKLTCPGYTIKHAIYPIALRDMEGLKNIERVINTADYNYWIKCEECLKVCPKNRSKAV